MTERQKFISLLRDMDSIVTFPGPQGLTIKQYRRIRLIGTAIVNHCDQVIAEAKDDEVFRMPGQ